MTHYQTPADLALAHEFAELAPVEAKAFLDFDHAAKRGDGQIPPKVREWISLAVALTTQCSYCLDVHTRAARKLGTTRDELTEIALIAAAVRAGATVGHGLLALRLFDKGCGLAQARAPRSRSTSACGSAGDAWPRHATCWSGREITSARS